MIPRYANAKITDIWSDSSKLAGWQNTELAVVKARVNLGLVEPKVYELMRTLLEQNMPDVEEWLELDKKLKHDLNAFIAERRRFLPVDLQHAFHEDLTSYDCEEPAFVLALLNSCKIVQRSLDVFYGSLEHLAYAHRYTIMLERTHGQGAKLRTFGGRVLTWMAPYKFVVDEFKLKFDRAHVSRISGAVGNYGRLTPEIECTALDLLGLKPFYGATQILPREIYGSLAQSLRLICESTHRVALDIRLGTRSGCPLYHEPFSKDQMGSSAMPHKKNPILTEQMEGMLTMARSYEAGILSSIQTWEGRAINQSCVERVFWPDLFHVVLRMLTVMTKVIDGLVVYQDNMLREIAEARGTYASDEAKNTLAKLLAESRIEADVAYRIVQLASFNVLEPVGFWEEARNHVCVDLLESDQLLKRSYTALATRDHYLHIRDLIKNGVLRCSKNLKASEAEVAEWNSILQTLFVSPDVITEWDDTFKPSHLLKQEGFLFLQILDG